MNNLKDNLQNVRSRVNFACQKAGRNPSEITIIAVGKRHPARKIAELRRFGQIAFGENYVQEALSKMKNLGSQPIEWHFIGPLQSNKTREVAAHFDWVQSVDRMKILKRLSSQRPEELPDLNICIQVNIDREPQKAGVAPDETRDLVLAAIELPKLRLRGLMAIPMLTAEGQTSVDSYLRMSELFSGLCAEGPGMDTLSMGMSADLEAAILNGSTMIRVGTDLFGPRPDSQVKFENEEL